MTVDFGTAFSKVAVAPRVNGQTMPSKVQVLRVGEVAGAPAPFLVPSAICLLDQEIYFGQDAVLKAPDLPERRELLQSFKLLLGAADLAVLLATSPPRKVDPQAIFTYRDLIILFLAYVLDLTEQAMGGIDLASPAASSVVRYTRPGWFSNRTVQDHAAIVDLLQRSKAVLRKLGAGFWKTPLGYNAARRAIDTTGVDSRLRIEAGVFEATASASCHLMLTRESLGTIILDIGAGTTDIEGFLLAEVGAAPERIGDSRVTLGIAGDNIDHILLNILTDRAKGASTIAERAAVWRALLPQIRALKAQLFANGSVQVGLGPRVRTTCKLSHLRSSKDYKKVVKAITNAYLQLVKAAASECSRRGLTQLRTVSTGGGAALPFVQKLKARAPSRYKGVRISAVSSAPDWLAGVQHADEIIPVFNQLAVVIGGAVAPPNLLIASPAASYAGDMMQA